MSDATLPPSPLTWAYADDWAEEAPELSEARRRAREMGAPTPSRAVGAVLRSLVATSRARAVAEVGSGTGVTGGWILAGLPDDGTLTTVDADSTLQTAARDTFERMGVSHTRVRAIAGPPLEVLSRLSDGAYDLLVIGPGTHAEGEDGHALLAEARRLLSAGGSVVITPAFGDEGVLAGRHDLIQHLRDDPEWVASVMTVGEGVVLATRHARA
ncbi:MAG: methyltransferase [Actinobacteria bacterium]|nr:methyltransferase [Actinomycetota bacterium]